MYELSGEDIVSLLAIKSELMKDLVTEGQITEEVHEQIVRTLEEMTQLTKAFEPWVVRGEGIEEDEEGS